ncbi:MAG TPA: hypothetical protein VM553_03160 [Dongiaceae bacterium]|nr:hypothetical protein [Dongiaceae bacterium]
MAKFNSLKPVAAGLGLVMAASAMSLSTSVHAAQNPFATADLSGGYMLAEGEGADKAKEEGKCGGDKGAHEGKCGGEKAAKEGKCGEGKCGSEEARAKAKAEGKCGEGKCGEGKCGADKEKSGN